MIIAMEAFAALADAARIGPLSLVAEFDLALGDFLGLGSAAETSELAERLEAAGLIAAEDAPAGGRAWRWQPGFQAEAQAVFISGSPTTVSELESRLAAWFIDRDEPIPALSHAVASRDWPRLMDVIEAYARRLVFDDPVALARALAIIPLEALQGRPLALAIRHTWPVPPLDPATMPAPELLSPVQLVEVGTSEHARRAIETDLQLAIMYRSKGRYRQAVAYGDEMAALMTIAHDAGVPRVDELIAGGLLQTAITRVARGEYRLAIDLLDRAYQFAAVSERTAIVSDLAGRLALALALYGDLSAGADWLAIAEAAPKRSGLFEKRLLVGAVTARALIEVSRLEDGAGDDLAAQASGPVSDDWWAHVLYAQACRALGWGDRLAVLNAITAARAARTDFAEARRNDGIAAPLLTATEANLLMSLGRGSQAWAVLNHGALEHPLIDLARARLALITGDPAGTLTITSKVADDPAQRLELTLLRAAAFLRLERPAVAAAELTAAITLAGDQLFPFALIPRRDLAALIDLVPGASTRLTADVMARLPTVFPGEVSLVVLTRQEEVILDGLANDKTVAALAAELHLSEGTIKTHQQHLYRKLGVNSREAALQEASALGLLKWSE